MTINYVIKPDLNAVIATATDLLSLQEILDYYSAVAADPAYKAEYHRIFDYRHVDQLNLTSEELSVIARQKEIGDAIRGKTAIVSGSGFGATTIGKLYNDLAEFHRGRDHLIFETLDEAMEWLQDLAAVKDPSQNL